VVDLVLSHGDVTMFFNVNSSYSILDLAKNAEKADYDFLHTLLVKHASGVYVLADPPTIEDGEQISAAQVRDALSALRSMFDYIIIDTPHQFDERTLTALEMSDIVLLVSLLNLPSLKNTQKCLELFGGSGCVTSGCDSSSAATFERRDPEGEHRGDHEHPGLLFRSQRLPTVISSINRGKLLSEIAPDKEVTKSFDRMAELLEGPAPKKAVPERKRGSWTACSAERRVR